MSSNSQKQIDNADNLLFICSIINDYEAGMDEMIESISELRHEIREREFEAAQYEKNRINKSGMFSPNEAATVYGIEDISERSISELKNKVENLEAKYREYKDKVEKLKKVRDDYETLAKKTEKNAASKKQVKEEIRDSVSGLKLLEIQELERNRIAGDLHDSAVQYLTGLVHKSELCVKLFDIDQIRARLELSSIIDVAKATIVEIREAIFNLRPASMDDFGLADSIDNFINTINKEHKVAFTIYKEGKEFDLEEIIQMNLYRIAQEACNNIMKHSKATTAGIILKFQPNRLQMIISDNGVGISDNKITESKYAKKNFGISIMRERCGVLDGTFEIANRPEGGTVIHVSVPIDRIG